MIGQIVAYNSTVAVTFGDAKSSTEILLALKARPNIMHACLVLPDGEIFAEYGLTNHELIDRFMAQNTTFIFEENNLFYLQPIILDGDQIGSLLLQSNYEPEFMELLELHASILIAVLMASILLTFLLSKRLQRIISDPILKLTHTASIIAEYKDYSVRAEPLEEDELGLLTDAFNQMLEQIQQQADTLQTTHTELEKQVKNLQHEIHQRQNAETALRDSEQRYRMLFQTNPLPLWVYEVEFLTFLAVNDVACKHYGYTEQEFLSMTLEDIGPPEDIPKLLENIKKENEDYQPSRIWRHRIKDGTIIQVEVTSHYLIYLGQQARIVLVNDVTERERARKELEILNKQLMEASRQAGRTDVATGVIHNVDNVLNSVNISTTLIQDRIRHSRTANLSRVASLLQAHETDLGTYITEDEQGRFSPKYLIRLAGNASQEQENLLSEVDRLVKKINHIKNIVSMQQSYAKTTGVMETIQIDELVEDAIQITATSFTRDNIQLHREYIDVFSLRLDRHKVMQVLVNLLTNAHQALKNGEKSKPPCITIHIARSRKEAVTISIIDNGIGIPQNNLIRIFAPGFTSKKEGHGFGLHSSALAINEMGGTLITVSDGPETGATFILELPIPDEDANEEITHYD